MNELPQPQIQPKRKGKITSTVIIVILSVIIILGVLVFGIPYIQEKIVEHDNLKMQDGVINTLIAINNVIDQDNYVMIPYGNTTRKIGVVQ